MIILTLNNGLNIVSQNQTYVKLCNCTALVGIKQVTYFRPTVIPM